MKNTAIFIVILFFIFNQNIYCQSNQINFKELIKNQTLLFSNPHIPDFLCEHNDELASYYYSGIVQVNYRQDPETRKAYDFKILPINRSFNFSIYPLEIVNDSLVICTSVINQKLPEYDIIQSFFIINLKTVFKLNEISSRPIELSNSNYETVKYLTRFNKYVGNEALKLHFNDILYKSKGDYHWNDEFQKHDFIDEKIQNLRKVNLSQSEVMSDYKLIFKAKLGEFDYERNRFGVGLELLVTFSKSLLYFPFDIRANINNDILLLPRDKFGPHDNNSQRWSSFRGQNPWTFKMSNGFYIPYKFEDGKKLVRSLNKEREILITLKLIPLTQEGNYPVKSMYPKYFISGLTVSNLNFKTEVIKIEPYIDKNHEDRDEFTSMDDLDKLLDLVVFVNRENKPKIIGLTGGRRYESENFDQYEEDSDSENEFIPDVSNDNTIPPTNNNIKYGSSEKFVTNPIISQELVIKNEFPPEKVNEIVNSKNSEEETFELPLDPDAIRKSGINNETEIYSEVDDPARFPGDTGSYARFIAKNMKYPNEAQRANWGGVVYLSAVINIDGSIQDIQVLKGVGKGCDEEAIRVIKLMPRWLPGKISGRSVRSRNIFPFTFTLSN
jgi:TonB family protein